MRAPRKGLPFQSTGGSAARPADVPTEWKLVFAVGRSLSPSRPTFVFYAKTGIWQIEPRLKRASHGSKVAFSGGFEPRKKIKKFPMTSILTPRVKKVVESVGSVARVGVLLKKRLPHEKRELFTGKFFSRHIRIRESRRERQEIHHWGRGEFRGSRFQRGSR